MPTKQVLDFMVNKTVPPGDPRSCFQVTEVHYGSDGVTVTTEGRHTYTAPTVLATFPVGVLLRHHRDLFTPDLPTSITTILE
eukprot:gene5279-5325_t